MYNQVYALCLGPTANPTIFYVGISNDPERRFEEHQRDIADGNCSKRAYEWVRYHRQRATLHMIVLDPTGSQNEDWWIRALTDQGYELQNTVGGVKVERQRRTTNPHTALLKGTAVKSGPITICQSYYERLARVRDRASLIKPQISRA